jgi:hypothetical protein
MLHYSMDFEEEELITTMQRFETELIEKKKEIILHRPSLKVDRQVMLIDLRT